MRFDRETRPAEGVIIFVGLVLSMALPAWSPLASSATPESFAIAGAPCPDNDLDLVADCAVPGCDPAGLTCGDCNDGDPTVYPNAPEDCDHQDDDCNGAVDEGFPSLTAASKVTGPGAFNLDRFGISVARAGDLTGDGVEDIVAGAFLDNTVQGVDAGSAAVISGADRSSVCLLTDPAGATGDRLGIAVAALGDVTGDGVGDIAAGAHLDDTAQGVDAGSVVVFSGADCTAVRKCTDPIGVAGDQVGSALAGLGDITGDGVPEIVAGAPRADTSQGVDAGSALVFSGADCSVVRRLTDPLGAATDRLGSAVTMIGDVTGDGVPEVAAGAPFDDGPLGGNVGSVVIFSGADGSVVRKLIDPDPLLHSDDNLGSSLAGAGDVTGDGVEDLVAGAPRDNGSPGDDAGSVVIFSGADGAFVRKCVDPDGAASDQLGVAVAGLVDITGDGVPEVVAGAFLDDTASGIDAGSAVIFSGADCAVVRKLTDPNGAATDQLGGSAAVASVGDLTGDGVPELAVGASQDDDDREAEPNIGSVIIFSLESDCDGDGVSPYGGDCDDADPVRFSGNPEVCDVKDNDCDLVTDEDGDRDGFAVCNDCDDMNLAINPGAAEACNGTDDDCDTLVDEGVDLDGDGYTTPCDCDDASLGVHPGATETCDNQDDDCDGVVDEGSSSVTASRKVMNPGPLTSDRFGISVARAGDLTGDGVEDLVVGAFLDNTAQGQDAGSAAVISGADRSTVCLLTDPAGAAGDRLGISVAALGDVTGDGVGDIAAGAYQDDTGPGGNQGSVVIFSGADCSPVRKCTDPIGAAVDELGSTLARLGDITGDGVPEIVAGAPRANTIQGVDAGSVLVFSGADCTVVRRLTDPFGVTGDRLGSAVTALGDVTGDGVPEVAAGVPFDDGPQGANHGSVVIFSGADGSVVRKLTDPDPIFLAVVDDNLGASLSGAGDVTGDGVEDLVAGAPRDNGPGGADAGSVVIFSGADGAFVRKCVDPDGAASDQLGIAVTKLMDITGDGVPEVVAGAFLDDTINGIDAGSAVIFSGANCASVRKLIDPNGAAGNQLGGNAAVASAGDLTGDGVPEVAAGASFDDLNQPGESQPDRGSVTIFASQSDCDGDGVSPYAGDCDDADPVRFSGNLEVCDTEDNDCDGLSDEDQDGDGVGLCNDCDDANPTTYPGAIEVCNGRDDDCDTLADEGVDFDGDGSTTPCDCDDGDPGRHPAVLEVCDHADNNCNGRADEGFIEGAPAQKVSNTAGGALSQMGNAVAPITDVTGDGAPDLLVGSYLADGGGVVDSGSVLVVSGRDRTVVRSCVDPGALLGEGLGWAVAASPDLTGDGVPDILAGARLDDTALGLDAGSVVVFSGADCSFVRKCTDPDGAVSDELGYSVAVLADSTGDGVPELAAGAWLDDTGLDGNQGSVVIFSGADCSVVRKLVDPFAAGSDGLGASVAGIKDVTGDGVADILAGIYRDDTPQGGNAGSIIIFSGADGSVVRKLTDPGGAAGDELGWSVAAIADLSGDGVQDILAGARADDAGATGDDEGSVAFFSGADGSFLRKCSDPTGAPDDQLGYSVAAVEDLTGDGLPDVVAGANLMDTAGGADAGSAIVFSSADCCLVSELADPVGDDNERLGVSLAVLGDLTGDGVPEIAVGEPLDDLGALVDSGSVLIFALESDCDGDGVSPYGGDCDDADPTLFPGNPDVCDGIDNDCDLLIDEDSDGDGFAVCSDCNDADPTIYPGATELCDGKDNDCDLVAEDDTDGDGFPACSDCNNADPAIFPGATELCDGIDNDCDLTIDEGFDGDGDGFAACSECNDADPAIYPGATEVCDGVDNDCDLMTDEDSDADGFAVCSDCNDANPTIYPGAAETCDNGIDDNCNVLVDCNDETSCIPGAPLPGEVTGVAFMADKMTLVWDAEPGSDRYDVLRGTISSLSSTRDFSGAACMANDVTGTSVVESTMPALGDGLYFLIRGIVGAQATCRRGTYGTPLSDDTGLSCP